MMRRDRRRTLEIRAVLFDYGVFNLLAVVLVMLAVMRGSARPVAWLLAPLPLAFAAWLTLDAVKPIIVPRYLPSVTALLAVAGAYGWYSLRPRQALDGLIALLVDWLNQAIVKSVASTLIQTRTRK